MDDPEKKAALAARMNAVADSLERANELLEQVVEDTNRVLDGALRGDPAYEQALARTRRRTLRVVEGDRGA
jgi:hypothetical protein